MNSKQINFINIIAHAVKDGDKVKALETYQRLADSLSDLSDDALACLHLLRQSIAQDNPVWVGIYLGKLWGFQNEGLFNHSKIQQLRQAA